jgi:histidinol-phosphate aminotransferase
MPLSRRRLLEGLGAGLVAAAARPSLAQARGETGIVRLHRNENPYGPSPEVIAAMRKAALNTANRFPNVESEALRRAVAAHHRVQADQVVVGCGSTDILRLAATAFAGTRKRIVTASPTFDWLGGLAGPVRDRVVAVPLARDYSHDLVAMLSRCDAATGMVYLCNPNNPTGTLTRRQDLEAFLRKLPTTVQVVIDEAYHHYVEPSADYASFIDRPVADPRVIVTRSFSKIHGLAGLRVGYAVAAAETARRLRALQLPDSVNIVAATAAIVALEDEDYVRASRVRNNDDRQEFFNEADARMLRAVDARANFVLLNTNRPAIHVVEHLRKHNVLVPPPFAGFDKYIRVSLGTAEDMRAFWKAWDLMPVIHHMSM